jgi:acid phosphatase (class A)
MNLSKIGSKAFNAFSFSGLVSLVLLWGGLATADVYISPRKPDGIALLTPPPSPNSPEQAADLETVRSVVKARTPEELARANKDATLSLFNFQPAIGPFFKPGQFPRLESFFECVKTNISDSINIPKDHWQRLRPYQVDKTLATGKPEKNASYPSGHSTRGTVQSLLLAEIFPEKREAILEFGRTIGWDRVILAKHFPTDVNAGRVLGQAIVRELMTNENFKRDLADVKKEVQQVLPLKAEPASVGAGQ